MADSFICPFMSSGVTGFVLCVEGKLGIPSNQKDLIRQQAKGQIVDFDALVPKEPCKAWVDGKCVRLHSDV